MNEYKGSLDASEKRFALVAARFNESFVKGLIEGASDCLERLGASEEDIDLFWVPGAYEIPQAVVAAAATGKYDAVLPLGVVIRGATSHYDLVVSETARGLSTAARETGIPVAMGIVTADTMEQAAERCGAKMGNKGWDAAQAAVEMANLGEAFGGWGKPGDAKRGRTAKSS
jgi:6,7-dimethyl-8-ribityllumazine synthase